MTQTSHLGLIIHSREPDLVIMALLDHLGHLGVQGQIKTRWIKNVYSNILGAIYDRSLDAARDSNYWISELQRVLVIQINSLVPENELLESRYFGEREPGEWGWWINRRPRPRT